MKTLRESASRGSLLHRGLIHPVRTQLVQGVSPRELALACAMGFAIATFPLFGFTTTLCLICGFIFRLNQPVLQSINYILAPVQILLIPVFVYLGSVVSGSPPVSIHVSEMISEFSAGLGPFFVKYGVIGLHAVLAWMLIIPWFALLTFFICRSLFSRWTLRQRQK
jgi:uncharacterized protein (DUF2062 family)